MIVQRGLIPTIVATYVIAAGPSDLTEKEAVVPDAAAADVTVVFDPPPDAEISEVTQPALRAELLRMASEDQAARRSGSCGKVSANCGDEEASPADRRAADPPSANEVDRRNTSRMKEIIKAHGWPTRAMTGTDGARAAWLLVQHADHDVAFQRTCLTLMDGQKDTGQVSLGDLAYLTDRVRVNEGKSQRYGTQFHTVDGERMPRPIEDAENVEARRKAMGLTMLKEYAEFMNT